MLFWKIYPSVHQVSPGAKYFFWRSVVPPCEKVIFAYLKEAILHLHSGNRSLACHFRVTSNIWAIKFRLIGLRPCETVRKLGLNWRSPIKNQLKHSDSALNVDEKWSKNHCDLMRPDRVIALQSPRKELKPAFLVNVTLQWLGKNSLDHHSSLTMFDQHSVRYQTV